MISKQNKNHKMDINDYRYLPLTYRNTYRSYSPLGLFDDPYLNRLRRLNNNFFDYYRPYDRFSYPYQNLVSTNRYSYYRPELYKTSYNYTNPYLADYYKPDPQLFNLNKTNDYTKKANHDKTPRRPILTKKPQETKKYSK